MSAAPEMPRDFADRALRAMLVQSPHLRALLGQVAPEGADQLDDVRLDRVHNGFGAALRHCEGWSAQDRVGWQQLVRVLFYCGLFRRHRREHSGIQARVRQSVTDADLLTEVQRMAGQMDQTWGRNPSPGVVRVDD